MSKESIRRAFLRKRVLLTESEYRERCKSILAHFVAHFDFSHSVIVHCFLPIIKNKEVNTWPIVNLLLDKENCKVVVSRSSLITNSMEHYYYDHETKLIDNKWGIPEPVEGILVDPKDIDMVLVPLLAFDKKGMRVGYGKGYYDRFLSECRADVIKTGISLVTPVDQIMDVNNQDIPLDNCITPLGNYNFDH